MFEMIIAVLIVGWILLGLPGYLYARWEIKTANLAWSNGDRIICLMMMVIMGPCLSIIAFLRWMFIDWQFDKLTRSNWWNRPSKW